MLATLMGSIGGALLGATGGAGAIVIVPLTMFGMQLSIHESIFFSIALVGFTALFGLLPRQRWHMLHWQVAFWVALGGILTVPLGARLSLALSDMQLLASFAGLMLVVAFMIYWQTSHIKQVEGTSDTTPHTPSLLADILQRQWPLLFFAGILSGFLSGLFGVGSGFILVPTLVYGLNMAVSHAIATSLLIIVPLAGAGALAHLNHVTVHTFPLMSFLLGSVLGMRVGAVIPRSRFRELALKLFMVVLCCVATSFIVEIYWHSSWHHHGH